MIKRILHISKYYFPFIGGTEQVARDIVNALIETRVEQKVICFNEDVINNGNRSNCRQTVHETVDSIDVIRCGCITKIASQSISLTYSREIKKLMNEFRPDIVVFHYPNPFVTHLLLKYRKLDFKLILYWHLDITKQKYLGRVFHSQNIHLINRADKIIGATPKHIYESAYSQYFKNKGQVLPYAIDEHRLMITEAEVKEAHRIKEKYSGKILCFFIGRHVPYKGLRYLIEASKILGNSNIHFIIAGQGELTEELKELAKKDHKVEFVGRIDDSLWRSYLYACDIFCFPSITRNEAFGLALAEGMYYGKPAVTFTIPGSGVNYVNLNGVTGIECPNGDSKAYAQALLMLAHDNQIRVEYGVNARIRIEENFTTNQFIQNVKKLISEL